MLPRNSGDAQDNQEVHQHYQDIINCLPNIVYILDKNGILTGGNKHFLQLFGVEKLEELKGSVYSQLIKRGHFSAPRVQLLKQADINVMLSGQAQFDVAEHPIVAPDGNIIYYLATRVPLLNSRGKVNGLVVILNDISEQKKVDEQLQKMKERLQQFTQNDVLIHPEEPSKTKHRSPKVLMIEDNTVAQKATKLLLMQLDCLVDIAESGEKATSLFKPGKYDLVFMDISLEDDSGYLVSKKIRQLEKSSGHRVPIIALTGYKADIIKLDCNDYFMEGAITKPLTSEQARQIIEHYIYHMDIPVRGLKSIKSDKPNKANPLN